MLHTTLCGVFSCVGIYQKKIEEHTNYFQKRLDFNRRIIYSKWEKVGNCG
jgi:hypothetical protein